MSRRKRPIDRIAPNFADRWGADTAEEALKIAEEAPTTTDPADEPRCPNCFSRRITVKTGVRSYDHKIDTNYKCHGSDCNTHFDDALAPRSKFPEEEPVCPSCGSRLLRLLTRGRVRCLDCETEHEAAADAAAADAAEDDAAADVERPAGGADTDDHDPDDPDPTPDPIMPRKLETPTEEYGIPTGDDLRELREALDLPLRDVPVAAGTTIGRWERGEVAPRLDRLEELVEYYRLVDAARRAERLDAALGALDDEPEAEAVEDAEPASPEADPFDWVEEADLRAATDGGRR